MPESPELHLSRRCDFVFLLSLLDLHTSGPKLKVTSGVLNRIDDCDDCDNQNLPMVFRFIRLKIVDDWHVGFSVFEESLFKLLQNTSG